MRDKNLTYQQFYIQLEKLEKEEILPFHRFFRRAVVITPTLLEDYYFSYPLNFRLLRTLSIVQWYLPEIFHYRIWLDMKDKSNSQLNEKQKIEIEILLSSKENCLKYLYLTNRYSASEIFGNILGNDLRELKKILKLKRKSYKLAIPQRRRGYNDHGSLKSSEKWLPSSDFSFTEEQNEKERKLKLHNQIVQRILIILRDTKEI